MDVKPPTKYGNELMKKIFVAALTLAFCVPAAAETCHEKFVRVYTDRNDKGPRKILLIQEIKGAKPTKNYNYSDGSGDWMTEMIEPPNAPWSMVRGNILYTSSDKGKTWKKIRTMDSGSSAEAVAKKLAAAAATVKNAVCAEEELDGAMHETVEADYEQPAFNTSHHDKFWIDPQSGWITKSVGRTSQAGFESLVTQTIEKTPDLKLPTPD